MAESRRKRTGEPENRRIGESEKSPFPRFFYLCLLPSAYCFMGRIEQFQELIKTDPNDELLHYGLGEEYLRAGRYQEAVEAFKTAIMLKPDYSAAYRELGKALTKAGLLEEAKRIYEDGMVVAEKKGDLQTKKEMQVFLNRLLKK